MVAIMSSVLDRHAVRDRGRADGRPIVFTHGFGCDQSVWRLVAPAFETTHRVITFDHIGSGRSDVSAWAPERHGTLQGYAADVLEVLDALDLRDVVLVGHSVSASIAVVAANRDRGRIGELVLVGPSPRYLDDPHDGYIGGFDERDITGLLDSLDDNFVAWAGAMAPVIMGNGDRPELAADLEQTFCRTDPVVASHFARTTFLSDCRHELPRVEVPTLVIQCRDDVIASEAVGEFTRDAIPGSRYVLLEATGHCPHLSAPGALVGAIRTSLARR